MKRVKPKKIKPEVIERIVELLCEDVLNEFWWEGIGSEDDVQEHPTGTSKEEVSFPVKATKPAEADESEGVDEEQDDEGDDDQEDVEEYYIDVTTIQAALDQALSAIVKEKLLKEFNNPKQPPTLSDLCKVLFGRQSEFVERADYCEDLISGYEDRAHKDDLREAYNILVEIINALKQGVQ